MSNVSLYKKLADDPSRCILKWLKPIYLIVWYYKT